MSSYCLKCRINTESANPKVVKNKNGRKILFKCTVCNSKSKFIQKQEARGLLNKLKVPSLSDLPIANVLF